MHVKIEFDAQDPDLLTEAVDAVQTTLKGEVIDHASLKIVITANEEEPPEVTLARAMAPCDSCAAPACRTAREVLARHGYRYNAKGVWVKQ